jgi:hypothetical protein
MPENPATEARLQRATVILSRSERERASLATALSAKARVVFRRAEIASNLLKQGDARGQLINLASMAARVEGAYSAHAGALSDSAVDAVNLAKTDALLSECYFLVALGKISDMLFVLTGRFKWITTARTAVTDVANNAFKNPQSVSTDALAVSQGANLYKVVDIELGNVPEALLNAAKDEQAALYAVISLLKDVGGLYETRGDLRKVGDDWTRWYLTLAAKIANVVDGSVRLKKLYDLYLAQVAKKKASMWDPPSVAPTESKLGIADYLSALRYAIEALVNFGNSALSFVNWWQNDAAALQATSESALAAQGTGTMTLDTAELAALSRQALLDMIRRVNSAPDAHHLASDAVVMARNLRLESARLQVQLLASGREEEAAKAAAEEALTRARQVDRELKLVRDELAANRGGGELTIALTLDLIDQERRRIAALTGD